MFERVVCSSRLAFCRELKSAVEALHYQEHVQCLAQGYIEDIHMTDIGRCLV